MFPCFAFSGTLTYQVADDADDAVLFNGSSGYVRADIYIPYLDNTRLAGWRWKVAIPKGATITSATVSVKAYGAFASASTAILQGIDNDSCPAFSDNTAFTWATTGDPISWEMTAWDNATWYASSDIGAIVQAFIDRAGYAYNSYLGVKGSLSSGAFRQAYQYAYSDNAGAILTVNYTGGVPVLDVLMAEPEVRIGQKITALITNSAATDNLVAYLDGTKVFNKNTPTDNETITTDYSGLSAGTHTLNVAVVNSSDNVLRSDLFTKTWTTLHNGIPSVGIDENNAIRIDNVIFFPIGAFMFDAGNMDTWPAGAAIPFGNVINTTVFNGYDAGGNTIATTQTYLDNAATRGWMSVLPGRWDGYSDGIDNSTVDNVAAYVNALKTYDSHLFGYTWVDEPEGSASITPQTNRAWLVASHANDTNHPVFLNTVGYYFTPSYGQSNNDKIKTYSYVYNADQFSGQRTMLADIYSIDYYPYEYYNPTLKSYNTLTDALLALDTAINWNGGLIPVMVYIESQDVHDFYAVGHASSCGLDYTGEQGYYTPGPTQAQLKNLLWTHVIHGAKGITYFQYFCTPTDNDISVLNTFKTQATALAPVFLGPTITSPISVSASNGGRIDTLYKTSGSSKYIFSASIDGTNSNTVTVTVPGMAIGTIISVYGESRNIASGDGSFVDTFNPLETHIYEYGSLGNYPISTGTISGSWQ